VKKTLLAGLMVATTIPAYAAGPSMYGPEDINEAIQTYSQNEIRFNRDFKGRLIGFTWTFDRARKARRRRLLRQLRWTDRGLRCQ
jgi:hypothetical protein